MCVQMYIATTTKRALGHQLKYIQYICTWTDVKKIIDHFIAYTLIIMQRIHTYIYLHTFVEVTVLRSLEAQLVVFIDILIKSSRNLLYYCCCCNVSSEIGLWCATVVVVVSNNNAVVVVVVISNTNVVVVANINVVAVSHYNVVVLSNISIVVVSHYNVVVAVINSQQSVRSSYTNWQPTRTSIKLSHIHAYMQLYVYVFLPF